MLIPFEPVNPFTIGSLTIWVCFMVYSGFVGAVAFTIGGDNFTYKQAVVGALCGLLCCYSITWLFQSRVGMEFMQVVTTFVNRGVQ